MISLSDFNKLKEDNIYLILKNKRMTDSKTLFESVQNKEMNQYDVFISYSSNDRKNAIFIKSFLELKGYSVYIDLEDDVLNPQNVNSKTAKRLEEIILKSKSILYIHSQNSEYSIWCPWELGFGAGKNKRICIMEIYSNLKVYKQVYATLYPSFEIQKKASGDYYFYAFTRDDPKKWMHYRNYVNGDNLWKELR